MASQFVALDSKGEDVEGNYKETTPSGFNLLRNQIAQTFVLVGNINYASTW